MQDNQIKSLSGKAIAIRGNDIDTDRIMPARFLKAISFADLGKYPFYDERMDTNGNPRDHPFNRQASEGASILLVNSNFGCGSSREHAPQGLKRWGIDAIIGESFGEIFAGNCERLGIPACHASKDIVAALQQAADHNPATVFKVDLQTMTVSFGNQELAISLAQNRRQSLLSGHWDNTALLLANTDKVKQVYERLPYCTGY